MAPGPYIWSPIQCTLQLVFSRPNNGEAILAGSAYHGTSIIRYRREPYCDAAKSNVSTTTSSKTSSSGDNSEYDNFLRHRRVIAEKSALHLHALTTAGGIYKDAKVLNVQSYQVRCVSPSAGAATGVLKVVSVEHEDGGAVAAGSSRSTTGSAAKMKGNAMGSKKRGLAGVENDLHTSADAPSPAAVDWGSKLVLFEGASSLPPFCEVDLTIRFVGAVQSFDHGGIYAARGTDSNPNTEDVPLLTHFEVRFARCAFPSPDDPQYRLDWQLKSIQLPSCFHTILTNGEERGRKQLLAQQAMQVSFAPCGPLPAYVFSFACFPDAASLESTSATGDGLDVLEGRLVIPKFLGDITSSFSNAPIPVRVLARRQARIATATLERVLRLTIDAVTALQQLFQCPLPLLQCEHLDVLLGPTMPYISGMEHHCSIILNESIYQADKKAAIGSRGGGGANSNAEVGQTELIVHEVTHHWIGNALGLPFAVKEGICQVIEQCVADTLLGKPMRKYKADSGGSAKFNSPSPSSSTAKLPKSTIQASEKGHEFTGASYQHARSAIKQLIADHGFDRFLLCLQQLLHKHVVIPMREVEEKGGIEVLRRIGADVAVSPYLSTREFLHAVESSL
ncbi:aminopeptidase [Leishmania braziliensis MHOM/BR/75/M2904]|uniref:Aminopeptidase n=1 Tax=Leishmania braziliensis MHOM/BR/75/M2904 TaxID=420245 RepID=A0A3P3ZE11_LEIBR|nr:aminopeptidase [Leishmania braziliensis MHOM/BR/75/M2904]